MEFPLTKMFGACLAISQPPVVAQSEPGDRAFYERPNAIEFKRVDACPVLDEVATGEVRWVVTVEQSESSNHKSYHNGEINPARYRSRDSRRRFFPRQLCQISRTDAGEADPSIQRNDQRRKCRLLRPSGFTPLTSGSTA